MESWLLQRTSAFERTAFFSKKKIIVAPEDQDGFSVIFSETINFFFLSMFLSTPLKFQFFFDDSQGFVPGFRFLHLFASLDSRKLALDGVKVKSSVGTRQKNWWFRSGQNLYLRSEIRTSCLPCSWTLHLVGIGFYHLAPLKYASNNQNS